MSVTVKKRQTYGSVWHPGELIAGYENDHYTIVICTAEVERGPKGGFRKAGEMVSIDSPTWGAACDAVQELGFTRPTLTATQVRAGWRDAS